MTDTEKFIAYREQTLDIIQGLGLLFDKVKSNKSQVENFAAPQHHDQDLKEHYRDKLARIQLLINAIEKEYNETDFATWQKQHQLMKTQQLTLTPDEQQKVSDYVNKLLAQRLLPQE